MPTATIDDIRTRDDGFTLIELVVSLAVLAIGITGVIGVFGSAMGVAVQTTARTRAVALATEEIEALRALPYEALEVRAMSDTRTESSGGDEFTVETAVVWESTAVAAHAYKRGAVLVSWSDTSGAHAVDQSSFFYPGGLGPAAPAAATIGGSSCTGAAPTEPRALSAIPTAGSAGTAIDLQWQAGGVSSTPVATWQVERSTDGFASAQLVATGVPASSLAYRSTGLAPATAYRFRIRAVSPCGRTSSWSSEAAATTDAATVVECTLGTPKISPAAITLSGKSDKTSLTEGPVVEVPATGSCSGFFLRYVKTGTTAVTQPMERRTASLWATLPATGPWDVQTHTIDVLEGSTVRATLLLTVCPNKSASC